MNRSESWFQTDRQSRANGLSPQRSLTVGMLGIGNMGAWVAYRLKEHGADICAVLSGRSAQTRQTAQTIGVRGVDSYAALAEASDIVISIVPSDVATSTAIEFAQVFRGSSKRIQFIDFNAVSAATVDGVSSVIGSAGIEFVDGSIMGIAPPFGSKGKPPRLYVSGPTASAAPLSHLGLDVRVVGDRIGAASSLKCCIAGLSKGFTAVAIETILAAKSAGVDMAMARELAEHAAQLSQLLQRMVPDSYAKASRWVGEMNEIAKELDKVPGGRESFNGASLTFAEVAAAYAAPSEEGAVKTVEDFLLSMRNASDGGL